MSAPLLAAPAPGLGLRLPGSSGAPVGSLPRGVSWQRVASVPLSRSDLGLLAAVATGLPIPAIGRRLGISDRTVRRRMREVCDKLDVTTSIEAVAWAARRNLI